MKYTLAITVFLLVNIQSYSQEAMFVKGKGYEGYIFSKEHSIWGFPPEKNRYSPTITDIEKAESILKDNICSQYVKQSQKLYRKPPINKKTLKKYTRQYVGYLTTDGHIVIRIYLNRGIDMSKETLSEDIISVNGGGANHWVIDVNLSTKTLSNMGVNGIS
jgi:hypothetical protein